MATATAKLSTDEKKANIAKCYKFHKPVLDKLKVSEKDFIPKLIYPYNGEPVITFFHSEISRPRDLYIEEASTDFIPDDEDRTLYKFTYNPEFDTEYVQSGGGNTGSTRYTVPVEELTIVAQDGKLIDEVKVEDHHPEQAKLSLKEVESEHPEREKTAELKEVKEDTARAIEDCPMSEITVRDHLAMKYNKPISCKKWLNDLIEQNR